MTATEYAIAAMYYRLVYEKNVMTVADVPAQYREILEEYRREVEK